MISGSLLYTVLTGRLFLSVNDLDTTIAPASPYFSLEVRPVLLAVGHELY